MRRITIYILFIVSFVFLAPLSQAAQSKGLKVVIKDQSGRKVGLYKGSYALVIGVSNYTAGWPKLESVPDEINRVETALKKQGFHVVKVLNPTSEQLSEAFEDFIDKHGFDDNNRLLFFFSGHGYTRLRGKKGYLVPTDAPDPRYDDKGFARKAVAMVQILAWSRQIEAKHALFLFDSCFSGTIFKAKALPEIPPHISDVTSRPVRQFISAGSAGEEVPANSVFIPSFIRAVRGEGDLDRDGYVTGTELGMYLHRKVLSYDTGQTPQYGKIKDPDLDEGDFVFALRTPSQPLPPTPPKSDRIRDRDKLIEQREATKKKWSEWQIGMREDFAKAERYDRNEELTSEEKKEVWGDFISSYGTDNPYNTKDDEMRERANERVRYWKSYKVATLPKKPKYSPPVQKSGEIDRDGVYVAYANGIVRDTKTGLEWKVGPDRDTDWNEARSWVQSLNIDGGGWRMPTMDELAGLYKNGLGDRNMTPLLKTTGWWVWSGEVEGSSDAWGFNFRNCSWGWYGRLYSIITRAFAVRSRSDAKSGKSKIFVEAKPQDARIRILNIRPKFHQGMELKPGKYHVEVSSDGYKTKRMWINLPTGEDKTLQISLEERKKIETASLQQKPKSSRPSSTSNVIKRNGVYVAYANGIVKDTSTGLEWKVGPDKDMNWNEARSWVQSLNLDGGGWRMPTVRELEGLYKKGAGERNMTPLLETSGWWVWSGETVGSSRAKGFNFNLGRRYWFGRFSFNVRAFAVRSRSDG